MINLLPPKEKKEFALEIKKNLFITLWGMVLISLLCFILVLFSLKLYILGEVNSNGIILEQVEKRHQTEDFLAFKKTVQGYNAKLSQAQSFLLKEIYFGGVFNAILEIQRPYGLHFTGLSINRGDDGKIKVIILGFSSNRENILYFSENIKKSNKVSNVYFSPDSWIKAANSNFSVSFDFTPGT